MKQFGRGRWVRSLNVPGISSSQACGELSKKSLERCSKNIMEPSKHCGNGAHSWSVSNNQICSSASHNLHNLITVSAVGWSQTANDSLNSRLAAVLKQNILPDPTLFCRTHKHTHIYTHIPAAIVRSLLIWAHVDGKHVLIFGELFSTLFSPPPYCLWTDFLPSFFPLFAHPTITLLCPYTLDRKWAAGNGLCVCCWRDHIRCLLKSRTVFFNWAYHGDGTCFCRAASASALPQLTWWGRLLGRMERLPVNKKNAILWHQKREPYHWTY